MTTEEFIRDCAARGFSKTMVLEALGLCRDTFYAMLEAMPAIDWPERGQSLNCQLSNEARRGVCTPKLRAAAQKAVAARRELRSHTVDGVRGTIVELAKRHGVSDSTVRRRMRAGMSLEQALKTPVTAVPLRHQGFNRKFTA